MMQGRIEADGLQWFAVRMKRPQNPNRRTTVIGADRKAYSDRQGRARVRAVTGTGQRVFVHELLLRRAGFDVFLPVRQEWRHVSRFNAEKQLVAFPLFADWVFVGWSKSECRWADLMALNVVSGVMGTGGAPVQIKTDVMDDLVRKRGDGRRAPSRMRHMASNAEYDVGQKVRATAGPLEGSVMQVVEIGGRSTKAVMDLIGGSIAVEIRADLVVPC
jgi:transcription termination/antitermination protein NusG